MSHPMGRAFLDTSQSPKKLSSDVFPQTKSSSNSIRNEGVVKYFLPIRSIDQLRRQIKFNEEENVRDEQTILVCAEAIGRRKKKISEYQERIIDIQKHVYNYKCVFEHSRLVYKAYKFDCYKQMIITTCIKTSNL